MLILCFADSCFLLFPDYVSVSDYAANDTDIKCCRCISLPVSVKPTLNVTRIAAAPPSGKMNSLPPMEATPPAEACTRLHVVCSGTLNQDQLWKLFDLVPGLDFIDLRRDRKSGQVGHASGLYIGRTKT